MNIEAELNKIPQSEWPAIWCRLNKWEIHELIKHLKPEWWDDTLDKDKMADVRNFITPIMAYIRKYISDEALNREWNKDTMTADEHKIWYRLSDEEKIKYFEDRYNNSI